MNNPTSAVKIVVTLLAISSSAIAGNSLHPGGILSSDRSNSITPSTFSSSEGSTLRLVMQPDCNLVLLLGWGVLWSSGTNGKGTNCQARMQSDGNFVIYTGQDQPVFSSGTQGHPGSYLLIQNDGNVVIYNGNQALWSTGTDISYSQTCQSVSLSGAPNEILTGTCRNFFGQSQRSSTLAACTGIIANADGVLRCVISEDMGFDVVSLSDTTNGPTETKIWRIDRPNVRVRDDPLSYIVFEPGDLISFNAGGCVQTGGSGSTWKSYVHPQGQNSDRLYSGTVMISGVIGSPMRISGAIQNSPWPVPIGLTPQTAKQLFLHLGYQDDDYGDNGYWGHDDGNPTQCAGIGPAWVEVSVTHSTGGIPVAPSTSPGHLPFDLVWNLDTGVDANGLPVNPKWFYQVAHPGTKLDFQNTCKPPPFQKFADIPLSFTKCTTDAPTADVDTGLDEYTLHVVCPSNPIPGHLNWAIVTYSGILSWQGWSGDTGFWNDGDYNFGLSVPNNDGLVSGTPDEGPGLHLEVNESEVEFAGPLWGALFNAVQGSSGNPAALVDGKLSVVTGLFGIDGVHNGGYSESHPVYAMAVLTGQSQSSTTLDQTWDFFIKNFGNEGMCSEYEHYWDGESGVYYIEFPWPVDFRGRRATGVGPPSGQAWFWSKAGAALNPPVPQLDVDQANPTRTYLQVSLPDSSGVSGRVTLHYAVPSDFSSLAVQSGHELAAEPPVVQLAGKSEDYIDPEHVIPDPIARQRVASLPNPYHFAQKRTAMLVRFDSNVRVHVPAKGLGANGLLTHDRVATDPVKAKWNSDLEQAIGREGTLYKGAVPVPVSH